MPFGVQLKRRRKAGIGGFHAEYLNDRTAIRQAKQMGFLRSCFTAAALLCGGGMIYVAMHYVPAFVKPQEVLKLVSTDMPRPERDAFGGDSILGKTVGPYIDMFAMERSFLKAGQTIDVKYALPEGARMDVSIRQCRRLWIVEVFECQTVSQETVRVQGHQGTQRFTLSTTGFYHFDEKVTLPRADEDYRVIWKRS